LANAKVIKTFLYGREARNERLEAEYNKKYDAMVLYGYKWAIYAVRKDRTVVLFRDWRRYSRTSSNHMGLLMQALLHDYFNVIVHYTWQSPYDRLKDVMQLFDMDDEELLKHTAARRGYMAKRGNIEFYFDMDYIGLKYMGHGHACYSEFPEIFDVLNNPTERKLEFLRVLISSPLKQPCRALNYGWDIEKLRKVVKRVRAALAKKQLFSTGGVTIPSVWPTGNGYIILAPGANSYSYTVYNLTFNGKVYKVDHYFLFDENIYRIFVSRTERPRWKEVRFEEFAKHIGAVVDQILPKIRQPELQARILSALV